MNPYSKYSTKSRPDWGRIISWFLICIALTVTFMSCEAAHASTMTKDELNAHMDPYFQQVVDAIYIAEGGKKAKKPFGILSVSCNGYADCRNVAYNTVRNNYHRWIAAGRKGEYLAFLANRYCPIGASNDPKGLNKNWLGNVSTHLAQ